VVGLTDTDYGTPSTTGLAAAREGEARDRHNRRVLQLPETKAGRSRRRRKRISLVTAVIMLAASTVGAVFVKGIPICQSPWSGVYWVDGECVGVTDGSYVFDLAFTEVQERIAAENKWAEDQDSYVTVALLNPLTAPTMSVLSKDEILKQIEGAYTAQHRINCNADPPQHLETARTPPSGAASRRLSWSSPTRAAPRISGNAWSNSY
jgi:hypothetical protein